MDACEDLRPTAFSYLRSTGATVKVNKGGGFAVDGGENALTQ